MDIINPNGKKTVAVSTEWLGRKLTLEVNRVGFRTTSSVLVTYGDTVVLGSVVVGTKPVVQISSHYRLIMKRSFMRRGKLVGRNLLSVRGSQRMKQCWWGGS